MNNTIYGIDLTRALPPTLKNDEDMLALARVIGAELQETGRLIRQNIIYPRIDELPENVLDILAYDLHVDWYDFDYPIEAKRSIIKDSVKVHKRLGTVYATLTALRSVYPNSEIEEWFDYGGEPFLFRVVIDVTKAKAPAEYFQIKRAIDAYKRLTAHMESLIYQCRIDIEIAIETRWWWLSSHRTGKALCGTYPQRNTRGALGSAVIAVQPEAGGFGFSSTPAGTAPQRSTVAALRTGQIEAHSSAEGFGYTVTPAGPEKAGTGPQRATRATLSGGDISIAPDGSGYGFQPTPAGTAPQRSTVAALRTGQIEARSGAEGFGYTVTPAGPEKAGTAPQRATRAAFAADGLQVSARTVQGRLQSTPAGTKPQRGTGGGAGGADMGIDPDGGGFGFHTPAAGTTPGQSTQGRTLESGLAVSSVGDGRGFSMPLTGTGPQRAARSGLAADAAGIDASGAAYGFTSAAAGSRPGRVNSGGVGESAVSVEAGGTGYSYTPPPAGTAPPQSSGIIQSVTAEGYSYRVKRCGTARCGNNRKKKGR